MDRKKFIKSCGYVCLGGVAISAILESCASTNYFVQNKESNNLITLNKNEFVKEEKGKKIDRNYVLVKSEKFDFPICIYKINESEYSALLLKCTHNGCELQPQGAYLICPCHGSEFSNKGIVQNPPAEENLKTFKITTDHENIYIHL